MAGGTLVSLLPQIEQLLRDAFNHRNDENRWECTIEQPGQANRNATMVLVQIEATGFTFKIKDGDRPFTLQATPAPQHMNVKLNGTLDAEARLVFRPAPSIPHPQRFHLDFRPVTVDGAEWRFDFAFE